ncbi:Polycomb protein SCMH1 [Fasciola gigantica]|uniref:Polycomb protein SCMH1 n=1 Tax=Fasciola gigantica TaxID=46835 RepID=A0A504YHB6_FASGI|nr:Polycomb protein SCMH1 [Fasciola gigantica]
MSGHTSSDTSTSFEWDEYLVKINGRPADPKCFKQSRTPPENHFEVNTLLEAEDQRSAALDVQTMPTFTVDPSKSRSGSGLSVSAASSAVMSGGLGGSGGGLSRRSSLISSHPIGTVRRFRAAAFSLARVVEVWGARLRIRLVGTDDRNDCWFLVDSDQIRPYPSGNPLQPPFGYIHNHLVWNRTLKRATEGAKFAETTWFIEPPPDPADNYFQVGDKLEAVDRRNTQLICPATVGAVNGQHILVSFDGWSGAFDYWTRFDSRELFPVGWCKRADYPLQPPGPNALRSPPSHSTPGPLSKLMAPPIASGHAFPLDMSSVSETPTGLKKPRTKSKPRQKQEAAVSFRSVSRARSRRVPNSSRKRRRKPHNLGTAQTRNPVPCALSRPLALTIQTNWTTDAPLLSNKLGSDTSHPQTESTDSSMRSLGSPPPPIIHPVIMDDDDYIDGDSLLNVTTGSSSSDPPPPSIEAAVTVTSSCTSVPTHSGHDLSSNTTNTSSVSRGRRTSSSSDCVVRLQAKSPPTLALGVNSNELVANHPELKSWQVVSTEPRPKPKKKSKPDKKHRERPSAELADSTNRLKKKFKFISDHPDPTPKPSSDWKSDDRLSSPVERSTVKPGPLTVDTTEHSLHPHQNQHISHLALSADTRDGHSHLSAGSTQAYTEDYHPSNRTESASRPQKSESFILKFPHEFDGLAEVSDDYLDSQSLAPHVSSSTVSPSSLDLGPCPLPNPSHWTIDEVCHYIATRDSSLLEVAQKFKHHEIDGQALLLLTMEALRNYLKIKLGPALKVDHLISRLKRGVL